MFFTFPTILKSFYICDKKIEKGKLSGPTLRGNTKMKTLLKIKDNLNNEELSNLNNFLESENIDGIEISYLGGAFGPVWDKEKNYNLDYIEGLTNLKALSLFLPKTIELNFLPNTLNWLNLGEFNSKKVSLEPISNLKKLKSISIVRNSYEIYKLYKLKQLEQVAFTGYKLSQLEFVSDLEELRDVYLGFGGGENIDFLINLRKLKILELLRIKKLSDITSISKLSELEWLKIEDQAQIEVLPDFSNLKKLKHLSLINLKTLTDISSLENCHIEELVILNVNLTIEQLEPLVKSNIKRICISLKNKKNTRQIEQILDNRIVEFIDTNSQKEKEIKYYRQRGL